MGEMRWTVRIVAVLAILLLAYAIWPVIGFYRIASAIEARDAAALAARVDFRALRKNLTKQVVAAYIELTGKEQKLGLLGKSIAIGVGTSYADPIIARLLNEETLIDLLTKGEGGDGIKIPADFAPFSSSALKSGWQTWMASEYGLGDYYVRLPPDRPVDTQFRVKLSLTDLRWKLAGIDLPDQTRIALAQQLIKHRESEKQ
jgi:hypothetical protein